MQRPAQAGDDQHRDRLEILDRIVRRLARRHRIDDQRAAAAEQKRVPVGLGARDRRRAERATGAADILDHHRDRAQFHAVRPRAGPPRRRRRPAQMGRPTGSAARETAAATSPRALRRGARTEPPVPTPTRLVCASHCSGEMLGKHDTTALPATRRNDDNVHKVEDAGWLDCRRLRWLPAQGPALAKRWRWR